MIATRKTPTRLFIFKELYSPDCQSFSLIKLFWLILGQWQILSLLPFSFTTLAVLYFNDDINYLYLTFYFKSFSENHL